MTGGWQAFLHPSPVPGGWPTLVKLEREFHQLGCLVQAFICPIYQDPQADGYDLDRGPIGPLEKRLEHPLSQHDVVDRMKRVLNNVDVEGLKLDVLYYDGYDGFALHADLPQDFSLAHPMSRRQNIEAQLTCFAETRRRGTMPGAELARFWAVGECDYFFFTDWANDRLTSTPNLASTAPAGIPVPLFQLVFNDCYMAGFSGGGYARYAQGMDWWEGSSPRLYELMHAASPAYNWLPDPHVPIDNWDSAREARKREWLRLWRDFYSSVAFSEMTSHRIGSDPSQRQIEFANGVSGEFDLSQNRFRIFGVGEIDEAWQEAPSL